MLPMRKPATGEPCAGEPHAWFRRAGGKWLPTPIGWKTPMGYSQGRWYYEQTNRRQRLKNHEPQSPLSRRAFRPISQPTYQSVRSDTSGGQSDRKSFIDMMAAKRRKLFTPPPLAVRRLAHRMPTPGPLARRPDSGPSARSLRYVRRAAGSVLLPIRCRSF
jgi:hypothetical protein